MDNNFNEMVALAGTFCRWIWKARNNRVFVSVLYGIGCGGNREDSTAQGPPPLDIAPIIKDVWSLVESCDDIPLVGSIVIVTG